MYSEIGDGFKYDFKSWDSNTISNPVATGLKIEIFVLINEILNCPRALAKAGDIKTHSSAHPSICPWYLHT